MIFNKYGGLCAYTGKPLGGDWQVDHIIPKCSYVWHQPPETKAIWGVNYDVNDIRNLLPAIKIVNHYKRSLSLEQFRQYMMYFHKRLAKLPKKTRIDKTKNRIRYMKELADLFGITPDNPFTGMFYFETHQP